MPRSTQLIECIPNFSEGKNKKKIEAIAESILKIKNIKILDVQSDKDHNRSVITFIGTPEQVVKAAFQATKTAANHINLNKHKGVHPRIGATDVIPLVPIKNITFKECIKYANQLGKQIGANLKIPVYLYEKAATTPKRKNLADVRRGEYESLKIKIKKDPQSFPDFGPKELNKAGATAISVRDFLIAFNVNLKSNDLAIAQKIANHIREKNGGMKGVKALGLRLKNKKISQISMNLTNYKKTSPLQAFKAIEKLARQHNVEILESELIGLTQKNSMPKDPKKTLKLTNLKPHQIIDFKKLSLPS